GLKMLLIYSRRTWRDKVDKLLADLGYRFESGRAMGAAELYEVQKSEERTRTTEDKSRQSTTYHGNHCENVDDRQIR
ncbi:MAG: hypothetical protein QF805_14270, partial [Pirellulaceae bacterium]|nr:hypothetical protein [Pirellulaceae bacterium]